MKENPRVAAQIEAVNSLHEQEIERLESQRGPASDKAIDRRIKEARERWQNAIIEILEADDSPSSRRLENRIRQAGSAGFAIVAFLNEEILGILDVFADTNSRSSELFRRALRGECDWVNLRVNNSEWRRQVELEFLGAGVPLTIR